MLICCTKRLPRSKIPVSGNGRILWKPAEKIAVSGRKAPEITGLWEQYSGPMPSDFSDGFRPFPAEKLWKIAGSHRNHPTIFQPGILLP
jgi:hypothetical protein